jgi:chromosome segregation ATPase
MNIDKIKSEINWYIEEIKVREHELEQAKSTVQDLESKIQTDKQKLEGLTRELMKAES